MLDYQKAFQKQRRKFESQNPIEESKEILLWMHSELSEMLNALKVKAYSDVGENPQVNLSNVYDGIIDIFKYNLMLMNEWNMNGEEAINEFYRKSKVVEQRWVQHQDLILEDNNCICVDIDGVLCNLSSTWLEFLEGVCSEGIDREVVDALDMSEFLLPDFKSAYSDLKRMFRESGIKANAIVHDGAGEFLRSLAGKYQIVLVSARPVYTYRRMYADTIEWLEKNDLLFDALVFEENKREWVLKHQNKVLFCIEDNPQQAESLANVGVKVCLVNHRYNQDVSPHRNIARIERLEEILQYA
jgi:uncharacterized HAD superfamily protein